MTKTQTIDLPIPSARLLEYLDSETFGRLLREGAVILAGAGGEAKTTIVLPKLTRTMKTAGSTFEQNLSVVGVGVDCRFRITGRTNADGVSLRVTVAGAGRTVLGVLTIPVLVGLFLLRSDLQRRKQTRKMIAEVVVPALHRVSNQ